MHLIMFDVDGTLVDTTGFDDELFFRTAKEVLGVEISTYWEDYTQATDAGVLDEVIDKYEVPGDPNILRKKFKQAFVNSVSEHIERNPGDICEIPGAARFLEHLKSLDNLKVAFATGGWEESAKLKLCAAGIDFGGCAFASCSDYPTRTEIMNLAESKSGSNQPFMSKTYFGDAAWDQKACRELDYRFVLVGNRIEHHIQTDDYLELERIVSLLGL